MIAEELGISRFRVARLLDEAVRDGIIKFEITPPSDVDVELSTSLARILGIREAVVVRLLSGDDDEDLRRAQLGRAGATIMGELVEEGDVVGVSWGRTLHAMVGNLPRLPRITTVQIVGAVPTSDLSINSLDLMRRIAERSGGDMYALHVPMVVDAASAATELRRDPQVARTIGQFRNLTRAVVGVGSWRPAESALRDNLPHALRAALDGAGAVADVCSSVLNEEGREVVVGNLPARCIAITGEQLRQVPDVTAIVGGPSRARAIRVAAKSGLIHRLITDDQTARALIALAG